jgi:hypothetical protein
MVIARLVIGAGSVAVVALLLILTALIWISLGTTIRAN